MGVLPAYDVEEMVAAFGVLLVVDERLEILLEYGGLLLDVEIFRKEGLVGLGVVFGGIPLVEVIVGEGKLRGSVIGGDGFGFRVVFECGVLLVCQGIEVAHHQAVGRLAHV